MSKITIHPALNITVEINLDQMVTILCGDSGTGKTYIIDSLRVLKQTPGLIRYSGFNIDDKIIVDRESEINQIEQDGIKGKLIFVDRADKLQNKASRQLNSVINKCQNTWVLMKRFNKQNQNKFNSDVNFTRYGYKQLVIKTDSSNDIIIQDELAQKPITSGRGTRVQRYVLFEATTEKFMTITSRNLRTALTENYDIRGFASSNLKLASYFTNVRALNEAVDQKEQGEDIDERWLVYKKEIRNLKNYFYLVSESGEKKVIESQDFQDFCNNHVMIGVKQGISRNGTKVWMLSSQVIQSVNHQYDDISIETLPKLKSPEEVMAEILADEENEQ